MAFAEAHAQAKKYEADIAILESLLTNVQAETPAPMTEAAFKQAFNAVTEFDLSQIQDHATSAAISTVLSDAYSSLYTAMNGRKEALILAKDGLSCE